MATIALQAVGTAIGGPLGGAIGTMIGSYIDSQIIQALTPPTRREGPRLNSTSITASTEGAAIPRLFGTLRQAGQIIWATRFEEQIVTGAQSGSGKGGGGAAATTTEYLYFGNFALGLCEGPIAGVGRVIADGKEVDLTEIEYRVYLGTDEQDVDPLIEAKEGTENAPAYRGLAYIVFERLPLAEWGNRLPQFSIEVIRPVGDLEEMVPGVALIPGNEFGFDPQAVTQTSGGESENRHTLVAASDWTAALDRLRLVAPNVASVMLVVTWFGDDLRCGSCTIRPKVVNATKATTPFAWRVSGINRNQALVIATFEGAPAFGGTPNDASAIRAILDLKARGYAVTLCPFLQMDIAAGNALPNPYGGTGQPAYPWRGRITGAVAPGLGGTVDKTAAAATQVTSFMGTASAGNFGGSGTTVTYSGPNEWKYRRFILHCAQLAKLAGGVEAFLIGSEMVGLTQLRSNATTYPFVGALKSLAADAKIILGSTPKIGYAADWSEYNNHRPADASGDVLFNLDPLWSDANIAFVGIDNYMPLSDWRDGAAHADFAVTGPLTIYDRTYLAANVEGGEYYDWRYASQADRDSQTRTAIADADPANEPWVFRQKDIRNWWSNAHHDRPAGVRSEGATGWTAQSKPVRFIEFGCAAVDKGANQPNAFIDAKSSESAWPRYSSRARDDAMQRAFLETLIDYWTDNNPVSSVYAAPMIALGRSHIWAWDVRPPPSFPNDETTWPDAPNWQTGHWISGRLGAAPARETVREVFDEWAFADFAIADLPGAVDGALADRPMTARAMLEALQPVYLFDLAESEGTIKVVPRLGRPPVAEIAASGLVIEDIDNPGPRYSETRGQETELPDSVTFTFADPARDGQTGTGGERRASGTSLRSINVAMPVQTAENVGRSLAAVALHDAWESRARLSSILPMRMLALDPGDVIDFAPTGRLYRLTALHDGNGRSAEAVGVDPFIFAPVEMPLSSGRRGTAALQLAPLAVLVDSAMVRDSDIEHAGYIGAVMAPFRTGMAAWRSPSLSGFTLDTLLTAPATIGVTTADFYSGPAWRWDRVNSLAVSLQRGKLDSATEEQVLNGVAPPLAVLNQDGEWEYISFATATPTGPRSFVLTDLVRGRRGTEHAMRNPVPAGARVMLLDGAVRQTGIAAIDVGLARNWRIGPANLDVADPSFFAVTFTFAGRGRRPLSPQLIRGRRNSGTGDWVLSWIRRTRVDGDNWEAEDVALGETEERYVVEILAGEGGAVKRSVEVTTPEFTYTAAMQTADFGSGQFSFHARVAQKAPVFGRGVATENLIWVH